MYKVAIPNVSSSCCPSFDLTFGRDPKNLFGFVQNNAPAFPRTLWLRTENLRARIKEIHTRMPIFSIATLYYHIQISLSLSIYLYIIIYNIWPAQAGEY